MHKLMFVLVSAFAVPSQERFDSMAKSGSNSFKTLLCTASAAGESDYKGIFYYYGNSAR